MGVYYFVGSHCEIDNRIKLTRFGQKVTLSDSVAAVVIEGGGAILPEQVWDTIFTTADAADLTAYAYPGPRVNAPDEFKEKVTRALVAFNDHREGVK